MFGWEYLQTSFPFLESDVSFPLSRAGTADAVAGSQELEPHAQLASPHGLDVHEGWDRQVDGNQCLELVPHALLATGTADAVAGSKSWGGLRRGKTRERAGGYAEGRQGRGGRRGKRAGGRVWERAYGGGGNGRGAGGEL